MPTQAGKYVSPTWHDDAPPAIDSAELQAITDAVEKLDIGTYTKAETLSDATKVQAGLPISAVPDDMFEQQFGMIEAKDTVIAGVSLKAGDVVDIKNGVASLGTDFGKTSEEYIKTERQWDTHIIDSDTFISAYYSNPSTYVTIGRLGAKGIILGKQYFYEEFPRTSLNINNASWITPTKLALMFTVYDTSTNPVRVVLFDVVGNDIVGAGTSVLLDSYGTTYSIYKINENSLICMMGQYKTSGDKVGVWKFSINGNNLSLVSSTTRNARYGGMVLFNETTAILAYAPSNVLYYEILDVSGSSIISGGEKILKSYPSGTKNISADLSIVGGMIVCKGYEDSSLCEKIGESLYITDTSTFSIGRYSGEYVFAEGAAEYWFVYISNKKFARTEPIQYQAPRNTQFYTSGYGIGIYAYLDSSANDYRLYPMCFSTGKTAIVLKDAQAGSQVPVSYAGQSYLAGAVKGESKYSTGISTYAYKDNFISVKGFW